MAESLPSKQVVAGSSPVSRSIKPSLINFQLSILSQQGAIK